MRGARSEPPDNTSAVAVGIPPDSGDLGFGRMLRVGFSRMPFRLGIDGSRRFIQSLPKTEAFNKSSTVRTGISSRPAHAPNARARGWGRRWWRWTHPALIRWGAVVSRDCDSVDLDFYTKRGFEIIGQTEYLGHTLTGMVRASHVSNRRPETRRVCRLSPRALR